MYIFAIAFGAPPSAASSMLWVSAMSWLDLGGTTWRSLTAV